MNQNPSDDRLVLHLGRDELIIRQRYETLSILNDVLIGIIFLIGSLLFFSEATMTLATTLFVIGSALMLVRPLIRLTRRVHLTRIHDDVQHPAETARDF
ncbi:MULTISPECIES: YrhK family protein [unclassified Brachybacterium]|uniref:YrhK family protein n=1 Tax=unclassified Brachybacterium TaxID=2623841 RepID=UPI0040348ED1